MDWQLPEATSYHRGPRCEQPAPQAEDTEIMMQTERGMKARCVIAELNGLI